MSELFSNHVTSIFVTRAIDFLSLRRKNSVEIFKPRLTHVHTCIFCTFKERRFRVSVSKELSIIDGTPRLNFTKNYFGRQRNGASFSPRVDLPKYLANEKNRMENTRCEIASS